ncbi:MAG: radical SAM protein [Patescibacteria group bacterium]|jgi:radical SAM superfamily enzyme YgiQ (UPF0313 family)|nr:radical SAM protein [Patescibacteria group bacterium]
MMLQLIVPALEGYKYPRATGCVPLGLASIATYVRYQLPNIQIECFDGEIMSNEEKINNLAPNSIVGILTKTPNYPGAIKIAQAAKKIGSTVVMGGIYATLMADKILKYRSGIVDFIVRGFGEKPFVKILKKNQALNNKIITNLTATFNDMPPLDRTIFDMELYINNFMGNRPTWKKGVRGTNIFTHMGCTHKCYFCSRMWPSCRYFRNPILIWEELCGLANNHGINYVIDFSDAITQDIKWLRWLIESKPKDMPKIKWHVFSTAEHINDETLLLLKKLGVVHIFIGIETGDPEVALLVRKGQNFSPDMVFRKLEKIAQANFGLTPSFVFGLRGETEKSIEKTFQLAEKISVEIGFEEIFACELIPWPGSRAWEDLQQRIVFDTDILLTEDLKKMWIKYFLPGLTPGILNEYVEKTLALGIYPLSVKGSC